MSEAPLPVRIVRAFVSPAILGMVTKIYIPMLFPITFLIWLVAATIDGWLGLGDGFLPTPANYYVAATFFVTGAVWWLWTYEQLTRLGEGSPSPTAGRTSPGSPPARLVPRAHTRRSARCARRCTGCGARRGRRPWSQ